MSNDLADHISDLIEGLRDPDPERRDGCALVLGTMALSGELVEEPDQAARAIRPLIAALADPVVAVRAQAASALGKIVHEVELPSEEVVAILAEHFRVDAEPAVRCQVVDGLARLGGLPDVMPLLFELLRSGPTELREAIADALANAWTGDADIAQPLRDALRDDSMAVRVSAGYGLLDRGLATGGEVVPIVVEALGNPNQFLRCAAMRVLVKAGEAARPVVPAIAALADDPYKLVRVRVADAMVSTLSSDAIALPVLQKLKDDPDSLVRTFAAGAIERRNTLARN